MAKYATAEETMTCPKCDTRHVERELVRVDDGFAQYDVPNFIPALGCPKCGNMFYPHTNEDNDE